MRNLRVLRRCAARPGGGRVVGLLVAGCCAGLAAALTGCGVGTVDSSTKLQLTLHGVVHGGQQPVSGSRIHLFAAGTTGNGSKATDMLSVISGGATVAYVLTGTDGSFDITGDYHCTHANDQVYLAAEGGEPGLGSPNNPALVMVAALGTCSGVPSISNIWVDEVTTAAAAWALAPFAATVDSVEHVGATATNATGIANAFLDAQLLADSTTGLPATLATTQSIETAKLYALANALAGCVNSDGTSACSPLFTAATPPGGAQPTDTFAAALDVVQHPGNHQGSMSNVYYAIQPQTPYPSLLTAPPSDWTMSLTVKGGGLYSPTNLAVDAQGNVWVADYAGGLTGLTPQGLPISGSPFGVGAVAAGDTAPFGEGKGILHESFGLAVATNGNVWLTNEEFTSAAVSNTVVFYGAASGHTLGSVFGQFGGDGAAYAESMAADRFGRVLTGNYNRGDATSYNPDGTIYQSGIGDTSSNTGDAAYPVAVAADGLGGTWISDNDLTVTHADANGNLMRPTCCDDVDGLAADAQGNGWAANYYGATVSVVSPGSIVNGSYVPGTVLARISGGGLSYPAGVAIDAAQNVWVANYHGQTFSELSYSAITQTASVLSPTTGFGVDAGMLLPFSVAPDASGNLWMTNYGNGTVTMFFGVATPTATPNTAPQTAP